MAGKKRHAEMSGIFDFLKRKKRETEKERALALPEPQRAPGILEWFRPGPTLPAVRPEVAPAEPRRPGLLRLFEAFVPAPTPEAPPQLPAVPEAPAPTAPRIWEELFGPPAALEELPITAMFAPPQAEPTLPVQAVQFPEIFPGAPPPPARPPKYTFIRIPRLRIGDWQMPTADELAVHLRNLFMLSNLFADVEAVRNSPEWSQSLTERAARGLPVVQQVAEVVTKNYYTDFARLFNLPWNVIESYIGQARTDEELAAAHQALETDIIRPMIKLLGEAFEMLKPAELPGWFSVEYDQQTGTWWLYYVEAMLSSFRPGLPYGGGGGQG